MWDGARAAPVVQGRRRAAQRLPRRLCAVWRARCFDLYEASLDAKFLAHARTLADVILERFIDKEKGGFFFTSDDHEALNHAARRRLLDGSTPSGNSAAVMALLRLHGLQPARSATASRRSGRFACSANLSRSSHSDFSHMLEAVDLYQRGPTEVVIVGEPQIT